MLSCVWSILAASTLKILVINGIGFRIDYISKNGKVEDVTSIFSLNKTLPDSCIEFRFDKWFHMLFERFNSGDEADVIVFQFFYFILCIFPISITSYECIHALIKFIKFKFFLAKSKWINSDSVVSESAKTDQETGKIKRWLNVPRENLLKSRCWGKWLSPLYKINIGAGIYVLTIFVVFVFAAIRIKTENFPCSGIEKILLTDSVPYKYICKNQPILETGHWTYKILCIGNQTSRENCRKDVDLIEQNITDLILFDENNSNSDNEHCNNKENVKLCRNKNRFLAQVGMDKIENVKKLNYSSTLNTKFTDLVFICDCEFGQPDSAFRLRQSDCFK